MATNSDSISTDSVDVLVVGYGPVGAAMAALLGRYGVKTLVIDRLRDVVMMPRAIALDNEALRILQMVGLDDQSFERIAIQEVRMHCPYVGQFGRVNTSGAIDGHPKLVTFYQPELEQALRRQVATLPTVSVCPEVELLDLQQDSQGVVARVRDRNGDERDIAARYLVGADGAGSRVRTLIGQDFQGQTYAEDWLIIDANQRENKAIDHVEFICDPRRPTPHMPAPGGRERWEFMLHPDEKREEMEQPEKLAELLAPWMRSEDMTVERQAVYRFHARCCNRFQKERVFLVGDAAHITPPFVGQGLVAGLRDVVNLAWKLAWVCDGRASPAILASYDQERRPHARKMIGLAKLMGKLVMPRSMTRAIAIHGVMRLINVLPPARVFLEDLKIKPANRFRRGLFKAGKSQVGLHRGSQLPQDLVRTDNHIHLSDESLGDKLTLVGIGVDPRQCLDEKDGRVWESAGGSWLHLGRRGQTGTEQTPFAEVIGNGLAVTAPDGWLVIVRPDRFVLHDGPPTSASMLVTETIAMLHQ